ncbi:MAG: TPM domain-containing protein [Chitinophagaceae bacterium]|nr:TPM domain-containing protein [Chitinophagaceae bacterium]
MKFFTIYIFLVFISVSSHSQKRPLPESAVLKIFEKKYDSLRILLKDSLSRGVNNINDYNNVFRGFEKKYLDSLIVEFKRKSGIQITIFTYDSLMTSKDSVEVTTQIIGTKYQINTAIGLSFPNKSMSIWNDSLTNNTIFAEHKAKYMIDEKFIPYFKSGQLFRGTVEGLQSIIKWMTNRRRESKGS